MKSSSWGVTSNKLAYENVIVAWSCLSSFFDWANTIHEYLLLTKIVNTLPAKSFATVLKSLKIRVSCSSLFGLQSSYWTCLRVSSSKDFFLVMMQTPFPHQPFGMLHEGIKKFHFMLMGSWNSLQALQSGPSGQLVYPLLDMEQICCAKDVIHTKLEFPLPM